MENGRHRGANGTMAADIAWGDWDIQEQFGFYGLASELGWSCGLAIGFVHLDRRVDLGLDQRTYHYAGWDERFADMPAV